MSYLSAQPFTGNEEPVVVSVCLATFKRNEQLLLVLEDIAAQSFLATEIVIVDNDAAGSARPVVEQFASQHQETFQVRYAIQPEKNIALTRNMTLELATGDWFAFIDDDERASPTWLERMVKCALDCKALGVLGPVIPVLPDDAPGWIRRGGNLYECPRMPTGTVVPLNTMRIGNALLHRSALADETVAFDPAYGVTGGSDSDLLIRLVNKGVRIVWCDEALVEEGVAPNRLRLNWVLKRYMRGGQDYARQFLTGRLTKARLPSWWQRVAFFSRALIQMCVAAVLALVSLPFGRSYSVQWLARTWANFGKLAVLSGWHYREYA